MTPFWANGSNLSQPTCGSNKKGLDIYMNAIILTLYGFVYILFSLDTMLLTTPLLMEVGRLKVLIALLDEDALAPPFRNKAVLLSANQAVLSVEEGTCMLLLFR